MRKRFYVLAVLLVFTTGLVWAAGEHGRKKMDVASHVAKLKTELNLSDQQADQVRTVLEDIHKKMEAAKSNAQASPASLKETHEKLMAEEDARLKTILTPEQYTRYQQLKTEHMKEREKPHK